MELNFRQYEFTTEEEGLENLKKAVKLRDRMCGALYWSILNDDCIEIEMRLRGMGVKEETLKSILQG